MNTKQEFRKVQEQIEALHSEIDKLAKKDPNGAINKFKLAFINEVLTKANAILTEEYLPFAQFRTFDVESVPSNSDVLLVLSQYMSSFQRKSVDDTPPLMEGLLGDM